MPIIMTAHMAQSSARCLPSQTAVIIHALAPVIGPYMSRAITTIHIQKTAALQSAALTQAAGRIAAETRESSGAARRERWRRPSGDRYVKRAGSANELGYAPRLIPSEARF